MNYFKLLTSVLILGLISACYPQGGVAPEIVSVERDDYEYDKRKERDDDRDYVLASSSKRRSGNVCEEEHRDHECKNLCKEIYGRVGDRKDCEELTVSQIETLFGLYELLENPDEDDLDEIDPEDFDVYLNVSIASLDDLIDDEWNNRETREFLYWLINNEDVASVFEKEDDDYDTLTAILKNIKSFDYDDIDEPFTTKIESDKLMEVAIDSGNEMVIKWFMDYIAEKNDHCNDESVSQACFAVYCKIGKGIDKDSVEDWLSYGEFESYIEDIIDDQINADNVGPSDEISKYEGWTYGEQPGEFEDIEDISDNWVRELCGGLHDYNL